MMEGDFLENAWSLPSRPGGVPEHEGIIFTNSEKGARVEVGILALDDFV